ncbi:MAG TPA: hypothetical protein DCX03_08655 [Bacteroidales bacterium]|nr:hypothetical protein [Bacteroidales bacterium]
MIKKTYIPTSSKITKAPKTTKTPGLNCRWLNTKRRIWKAGKIERPCHACGYCPYGQLVEEFPCHQEAADYAAKHNMWVKWDNNAPVKWVKCKKDDPDPTKMEDIDAAMPFVEEHYSCKVFGHDCPAYYHAEMLAED